MILDKQTQFSDSEALTAGTNQVSENVYDLGISGTQVSDLFEGEPMVIEIVVEAKAAATGSETYNVTFITDSVAALSSPTDHGTVNIPSSAAAGDKFYIRPAAGETLQQFCGLHYDLVDGTGTATATLQCNLLPLSSVDPAPKYYNSGYVVTDF